MGTPVFLRPTGVVRSSPRRHSGLALVHVSTWGCMDIWLPGEAKNQRRQNSQKRRTMPGHKRQRPLNQIRLMKPMTPVMSRMVSSYLGNSRKTRKCSLSLSGKLTSLASISRVTAVSQLHKCTEISEVPSKLEGKKIVWYTQPSFPFSFTYLNSTLRELIPLDYLEAKKKEKKSINSFLSSSSI